LTRSIAAVAVDVAHATLVPARLKEHAMKITKKQLRRIIKEERARLEKRRTRRRALRESIADMVQYEEMMEKVASQLSDNFGEDMMALFDEEPEAFEGSSKMDWQEQVTYAQQELDTGIPEAIRRAIEQVEMNLHDGQYAR
tara:strand:- start:890 stop:1312 length:423 start_codon:yes stop_codon:yes gene_type:complete